MPTAEFFFHGKNRAEVSGDAVLVDGTLKLRRTNATGDYDRAGTFKSGQAILPIREIDRIGQFFSFVVTDLGNGTVCWQISGDGGNTWLFHDGAYWMESLYPGDCNTEQEIQLNIDSFPMDFGRDFRLKAFLDGTPNGKETPQISVVEMHYELDRYDFDEGVKRSLRRLLERNLAVSEVEITAPLVTASDTVTLRTDYDIVSSVISVFNITTDPNKGNDLFLAKTGAKDIQMITSQPLGSFIEVQFKAIPALRLAADPDYINSTLPVIVIETPNLNELRSQRVGQKRVEKNIATKKGRVREYFVKESVSVRLRAAGAYEMQTSRMSAALAELFQYIKVVPNVDTGEIMTIIDFSPINDRNIIRQELREKDLNFVLSARKWTSPTFEEVPLTERITFGVGDLNEKFDDAILE